MRFVIFVFSFVLLLPAFAQDRALETASAPSSIWFAPPGTYTLDPDVVSVTMAARRFLMSPIRAQFGTVAGGIDITDASSDQSALTVEIAAGDLVANGSFVERMLKGEAFLNVEVHPAISFAIETFTVSDVPATLEGDLTMAGISHPAAFATELQSYAIDPATGALRLRFVAEGELARADWGMTGYRGVVSDTVRIRIEADFVRADGTPANVSAD